MAHQEQKMEPGKSDQETSQISEWESALTEFTKLSRGEMEKMIVNAWKDLIQDLEVDNPFLRALQEAEVLDRVSVSAIQATPVPHDKADKILERVNKNIRTRLPALIRVMGNSDQKDLAIRNFLDRYYEEGLQ